MPNLSVWRGVAQTMDTSCKVHCTLLRSTSLHSLSCMSLRTTIESRHGSMTQLYSKKKLTRLSNDIPRNYPKGQYPHLRPLKNGRPTSNTAVIPIGWD